MDIDEITQKLKKTLKSGRFVHTMGVAYTAASLAMCYDPSIMDKAFRAGLLHDCGKYLNDKENIEFCEKNKIELTDVEKETPGLIHAKMGEFLAKEEYDEDDKDVIAAVRWHTTGHPGMSLLEKIIFISDYIEPNRNHDSDLPNIRQMAFKDIDRCLVRVYEHTLTHLSDIGKKQDPMTKESYMFYRDELLKNDRK